MSLYSSYSDGGHEGCRLPLEHLVDTQHETAAAMPLDSGDSVEAALDVADFQAEPRCCAIRTTRSSAR